MSSKGSQNHRILVENTYLSPKVVDRYLKTTFLIDFALLAPMEINKIKRKNIRIMRTIVVDLAKLMSSTKCFKHFLKQRRTLYLE